MNCSKCGAKIGSDDLFCPKCGTNIKFANGEDVNSQVESNKDKEIPVSSYVSTNTKKSLGDKIKEKLSAWWHGLDSFSKIIAILSIVTLVLSLAAFNSHKVFAIFFSILQVIGIVYVFLLHKGIVKISKKWMKYIVTVGVVFLIILNVKSYSWKGVHKNSDKNSVSNETMNEKNGEKKTKKSIGKKAKIPYDSNEVLGMNYTEVEEQFTSEGFSNVIVEPIEDLAVNDEDKLNSIENIVIDGLDSFAKGDKIDKTTKVTIKYHMYTPYTVNVHIDFSSNLFIEKYGVEVRFDGEKQGELEHGEDGDFSIKAYPGTYDLVFINKEYSDVTNKAKLDVKGDVNVAYGITCDKDEIKVSIDYLEDYAAVGENEVMLKKESTSYSDEDYKDVENEFKEMGFTNIALVPKYDIKKGITPEGAVAKVEIGGTEKFYHGDIVSKDSEIVITYHMKASDDPSNIKMVKSSSEYENRNYDAVKKEFEALGFTKIELYTYSTDEKLKNGNIDSVKIDGKHFNVGDSFNPNKTVRITYYEYKGDDTGYSGGSDSASVYYSTNDANSVRDGNKGVYSYVMKGNSYDIYYIIDFDEGYVYRFTDGNGDEICDRLKIDSGDLNDKIIVTYHDGGTTWQNGLHFHYVNQPSTLILQDNDGFTFEFTTTTLSDALRLRDSKIIKDY